MGVARSAWIPTGLGLVMQACSGGGVCDCEALIDLLAATEASDVIELGGCTVSGGVTVRPGITLAGLGASRSTIALENGSGPIELVPGDPPARLRNLDIESDAIIAVLA